jgi:hypothetical protein
MSLLSIPTWVIHLSSMIEWGIAAVLIFRYGKKIGRPEVSRFGLSLLPHWAGGWCVILFHVTNDTVSFWIESSKVLSLVGSASLFWGVWSMLRQTPKVPLATAAALLLLIPTFPDMLWRAKVLNIIFQLSSVIHLGFLVLLLILYRRDRTLFSGLTVAGFWFILIFISVSAVCFYYATSVRGYPTLTHDDLLHGFAESFLTLSNLMIVLGIRRTLRAEHLALHHASSPFRNAP